LYFSFIIILEALVSMKYSNRSNDFAERSSVCKVRRLSNAVTVSWIWKNSW